MNRKGHVLNAVLFSVGLAYVLHPGVGESTFVAVVEIGAPVTLGALFPDVDTAFGRHRKTFHNLPVLAGFLAFPLAFDNLQYVWIGVSSHYVLDVMGTTRGIALFYPWDREFGLPVGVPVDSPHADVVTVAVTGVEVLLAGALVHRVPQSLATVAVEVLGV